MTQQPGICQWSVKLPPLEFKSRYVPVDGAHNNLIIIIINNIFSLIKRLTNALRCTFTCYAIETILTTNRTDSLQYTALIAAYKAYSLYGSRTWYLSLSTPVVIQCAIGLRDCYGCLYTT